MSDRRIRVAHVAPGLDVGGLEKLLVEFARNIDRTRFDLQFISLGSRGRLADEIESLGWPVHALEQPNGLRPRLIWRLAKLFRTHGIDVAHSHDDRPLIYTAPAARLAGVPRIIHTKHYGQLATVTRRQNLLTSMAARLVHDFVCVSQHSAEFSRQCGVPAGKLRVIWNGIDLRRFPFVGPKADGPIVTVARLSPEKGLDNLLRAAAVVAKSRPDLRFQIAGNGPELAGLQLLVTELHLEKQFYFLGEMRDIPRLLAMSQLFVLASLAEGVSLTLLEAMATGLPVVATRVGGNPEVVEAPRTGLLVASSAPEELAAAILDLCGNSERGREMGRCGRERVENHFDICTMMARYEALYCAAPLQLTRRDKVSRLATIDS